MHNVVSRTHKSLKWLAGTPRAKNSPFIIVSRGEKKKITENLKIKIEKLIRVVVSTRHAAWPALQFFWSWLIAREGRWLVVFPLAGGLFDNSGMQSRKTTHQHSHRPEQVQRFHRNGDFYRFLINRNNHLVFGSIDFLKNVRDFSFEPKCEHDCSQNCNKK